MSENPYLKRKNKHKIGKSGRKSEKRLAKKLGARSMPGSGSLVGAKGDMVIHDFLIEAKSTVNDSMKLDREWLCKIKAESLQQDKTPILSIRFITESGRARESGSWYMVEESLFKEFMEFKEGQDDL